MNARMKKWASILIAIGVLIGLYQYFDLSSILSFDQIQENRDAMKMYVENNLALSIVLFSLAYFVSVVLSLPIATILTLLSGFLFGSIGGTVVVVLVATLGATIVFLLAKWLFHDWFYERFGDRIGGMSKEFKDHAFTHLLVLRLVPIFPFFLVNIAPAFTQISLRDYVVATLIGIIPGSFVYAHAGRELGNISNASDILSFEVILAFVLLAVLSVVPMIYKRVKHTKMEEVVEVSEDNREI